MCKTNGSGAAVNIPYTHQQQGCKESSVCEFSKHYDHSQSLNLLNFQIVYSSTNSIYIFLNNSNTRIIVGYQIKCQRYENQ